MTREMVNSLLLGVRGIVLSLEQWEVERWKVDG